MLVTDRSIANDRRKSWWLSEDGRTEVKEANTGDDIALSRLGAL
jgi:hypothetical protein